ncbi:hypothetical protein MDV098.3 [Gallid alphaherpesvirus 2]|nr:hypothetical protein MDV085.9 [Gallid alphaherpesvirus 2]UOW60187.1 hypothetical protein MDV098.3 [Gallid alphaherpesvirus 2]UOW60334.1 hypothetical protein MDV085.9 [Gallid alphaherpesvirus 2]UOW60359.1 hypothetical protein MDV098.3 [Gallid alphaherpesvirus 2]UOW60678.1 hypothetical protein MDV085.9 [Gallid alphaherpesvirus 2]
MNNTLDVQQKSDFSENRMANLPAKCIRYGSSISFYIKQSTVHVGGLRAQVLPTYSPSPHIHQRDSCTAFPGASS